MSIYDCSLWEYLKFSNSQGRQIPMSVRFKLFKKVLAGLRIIQDGGFRHLDIKPRNILLKTVDGKKTGLWNETDLVIIDFGIGGRNDKQTGLAGTPGFCSPEQLIGQSHRKSDNYSFGKLMVMIFCDWPTAWNVLYQPVTESEKIRFHLRFDTVVRRLLKVRIDIITNW